MEVETLIDDLSSDIDDGLKAGLTAESRDVLGARVADLSAEIDQLEQSVGADGVTHLRSLLDSADYKLVRAEQDRPELASVDSLAPVPGASSAPDLEI